ncbi:hypothetical protein AGMMS50276_11570 [Synergistales bacterium]|nr:hypothetical protein AGMMS50276_11570 [Synergistales bacterium]
MLKHNVEQFNEDIKTSKGYLYHSERLSSRFSNTRTLSAMEELFPFDGKNILDLGCGDGTFALRLAQTYDVESIIGIDPAENAIKLANERARGEDSIYGGGHIQPQCR